MAIRFLLDADICICIAKYNPRLSGRASSNSMCKGQPIGNHDLWTAAHARAEG